MKKIILAAVLILSLCGCSKAVSAVPADVAETYKKDFSGKVLAVFGENEAEMSITKNGMSISFIANSPAELEGMGIEISDEHAKVSYQGMEQEIRKDSLPEGTPFLLLEELFDELSEPDEFNLSTEEGNIVAENSDFRAVLSAEDFSPISAEFPEYNTKFTFSEWVFGAAE